MSKKQKNYTFQALYTSVDFARILKKNPNIDFISVSWETEAETDFGVVLLNQSGIDRLEKNGLDSALHRTAELTVSPTGACLVENDSFGRSRDIHYVYKSYFDSEVWPTLLDRENHKRTFTVTAIN